MSVPQINTAIPKRRYQLGEFIVSILGEVESGDGVDYRYVMAVAREADPVPRLFVSAERNTSGTPGTWAMRVSMPDGAQVIGASDDWNDVDRFTHEAIALVQKMLNLEDEEPYRLL